MIVYIRKSRDYTDKLFDFFKKIWVQTQIKLVYLNTTNTKLGNVIFNVLFIVAKTNK